MVWVWRLSLLENMSCRRNGVLVLLILCLIFVLHISRCNSYWLFVKYRIRPVFSVKVNPTPSHLESMRKGYGR